MSAAPTDVEPRPAPLAADDRSVWNGFRHHSRTFSLAARLLPRDVQMPVATLYLYCRAVDTVADERLYAVGREAARRELDAAERALRATLAGCPPAQGFWERLARVHERFTLPETPFLELIEGAAWDIDGRGIDDEADLVRYSDLVGGSIGAMMLPFLTEPGTDRAALDAGARCLGIAMQITNILRDVGEDRRALGRVYVPARLLDAHGLTPAALDADAPPPGYAALSEALMALAEQYFERGLASVDTLSPRVQPGIRAAARMYRDLLNEVRAAGYDNLTRRAVVPLSRKLRLLLQDDYATRKLALARIGPPASGLPARTPATA